MAYTPKWTKRLARASLTLASRIHVIRGHRVMLSPDLADLYGVEPRVLIQAVSRNRTRFPDDFMFQLRASDYRVLKSQIVISSHGGVRRARPYAFTEQGVAMLSSVLRSSRAIAVNVEIMRVFVRMRATAASVADLGRKLDALEQKYDGQFRVVFAAIRGLIAPPEALRKRIGFTTGRLGAARPALGHRPGTIAPSSP